MLIFNSDDGMVMVNNSPGGEIESGNCQEFPNDGWDKRFAKKLGIEDDSSLLGSEEFDQGRLSIHSEESIAFYRDTLSASSWVITSLTEGLSFEKNAK